MAKKADSAAKIDSVGERRRAVCYNVSTLTCACCVHCRHHDGWCVKNDFSVNLDRGFCNQFKFITRRTKA